MPKDLPSKRPTPESVWTAGVVAGVEDGGTLGGDTDVALCEAECG